MSKFGKLTHVFTLSALTVLGGYGCGTTNPNHDYQMRQVKGQTGQVVRDVGGQAGRGLGERAAEALGHTVTEEDCRLMRVEHQARVEEMRRNEKISADDIGNAQVTHQRLESSCDKEAQKTQKSKDFLGGISEQLGRIGGEILNQKSGAHY